MSNTCQFTFFQTSLKKIICGLSLLSSIAYATSGTVIKSNAPYGAPHVQCNNWGWVEYNHDAFWSSICKPLQVKTLSGEIWSVATTDVCDGSDVAIYKFTESTNKNKRLEFIGCVQQ